MFQTTFFIIKTEDKSSPDSAPKDLEKNVPKISRSENETLPAETFKTARKKSERTIRKKIRKYRRFKGKSTLKHFQEFRDCDNFYILNGFQRKQVIVAAYNIKALAFNRTGNEFVVI